MADDTDFDRQTARIEGLIRQRGEMKSALRAIWESEPIWPAVPALAPFARGALGVKEDFLPTWYKNAWWGLHAAIMVRGKMFSGQMQDVLALVDDDISFAPLTAALARGRGAILLDSHLGPGYVPSFAVRRAGFASKGIARTKSPTRRAEDYIFVTTPGERKTSLVQAVKHLRQGGVLFAAPTGQEGEACTVVSFLGHPLRVYHGISEIARISQAPVFWSSASWTEPGRLRLILQELPATGSGEDAGWRERFHIAYLTRLARQMRSNPADLGFFGGFWRDLPWHHKIAKGDEKAPA